MRGDHDEGDDEAAAQELRVLRHRLGDLEKRLYSKSRDVTPWSPVLVGQVFDDGAKPAAVPAYFACHPVNVGGVEAEGSAGVFDVMTGAKAYVLVLGSVVPDVGDRLIARGIDGRWVARKDGVAEETTPTASSCLCPSLPNTIHVTVDNIVPGLYMDHTLELTSVMAGYGLGTTTLGGTKYWYSPVEYTDGTADSFNVFRYCLICYDAGLGDLFFGIVRDFKSVGSGKENPVAFFDAPGHAVAGHGDLVQCSPLEGVHTVTQSFYATPAPGQVAKSFAQITGSAEPLVPPVTVTMTA